MVYNAPEDTKELGESFIKEILVFQSDSKLNFEGFIVWKTPNLTRLCQCCEYKYLQVSKQVFEFTIGLKLRITAAVISFISGKQKRKHEYYWVITEQDQERSGTVVPQQMIPDVIVNSPLIFQLQLIQ